MDKLRKQIETDPYYQNYLPNHDLMVARRRLLNHLKKNNQSYSIPMKNPSLRYEVATLIKQVGMRGSCRYIAEICFAPQDSRHGIQMAGRDLKRFAALVLGELFQDSAKISDNGEFWHEY